MIEITDKFIPTAILREKLADDACGAVVVFEGLVRNHHEGKRVAELSYECYRPMALKVLEQIRQTALNRWKVGEVIIVHRTGNIPIGEAAVWVGVSSAHRKEAFEACAWTMDEIKREAPIWKRETYEDGSVLWVEDNCVAAHGHG